MSVTQVDILDALYTRLTGNSTFNTAMGGNVTTAGRIRFGVANRDEAFPYCVITFVSGIERRALGEAGYDYTLQFSIYDDTEAGARAVGAHCDTLRARLDAAHFTPTGHQQYAAREIAVRGPLYEVDAWRIDSDYVLTGFD